MANIILIILSLVILAAYSSCNKANDNITGSNTDFKTL